MNNVLRTNLPAVEIPAYLAVKHPSLRAGLFSCSQQGFNIAMGPLTGLRQAVVARLAALDPQAIPWEVPPLLRADWVEQAVWRNPTAAEWCHEEPAGHWLTPRPLMHLVNRLRHHPEDEGTWRLSGTCFRAEDPAATLPLLRQRTFTMVEYARLTDEVDDGKWRQVLLEGLWQLVAGLDLPVSMVTEPAGAAGTNGTAILLHLPEVEPVSLARAWRPAADLLAAYRLAGRRLDVIGCGVERLCLGILARWGLDAAGWPDLES